MSGHKLRTKKTLMWDLASKWCCVVVQYTQTGNFIFSDTKHIHTFILLVGKKAKKKKKTQFNTEKWRTLL